MPKVIDYHVGPEVTDIMEKMLQTFPEVFSGFDVNLISCVHTKNKESARKPLMLKAVRYPYDVWLNKVYIVEVAEKTWAEMDQKRKNLAVFHTMCAIPEGAFDPESKDYARIKRPDYELYAEEFAVSGGVPNWMENDDAHDPMEKSKKKKVARNPVTVEDVANVGS